MTPKGEIIFCVEKTIYSTMMLVAIKGRNNLLLLTGLLWRGFHKARRWNIKHDGHDSRGEEIHTENNTAQECKSGPLSKELTERHGSSFSTCFFSLLISVFHVSYLKKKLYLQILYRVISNIQIMHHLDFSLFFRLNGLGFVLCSFFRVQLYADAAALKTGPLKRRNKRLVYVSTAI